MTLGVNSDYTSPFAKTIIVKDHKAQTNYKINSPVGEYGILYASNSSGQTNLDNTLTGSGDYVDHVKCGLIYYQAGVAILSSSVFGGSTNAATATVTVTDGDAPHGLTAGTKITITDFEGTIVDYFVSDTNDGGVAHEAAVTNGATLKSTGAITATLTTGAARGIAVGFNLSGGTTQNGFLVLLKAAIEDSLGHNGKITVSSVPVQANGNQSITLTQASAAGTHHLGNTTASENVANLTITNFSGGGSGGILATSVGAPKMLSTSHANSLTSVLCIYQRLRASLM